MARGYSERVEHKILTQMRRGSKHRKMIAKRANLNESTVGAALALMAKEGKVQRIGRGLYVISGWNNKSHLQRAADLAEKKASARASAKRQDLNLNITKNTHRSLHGANESKQRIVSPSQSRRLLESPANKSLTEPAASDNAPKDLIVELMVLFLAVLILIGFVAALVAWLR